MMMKRKKKTLAPQDVNITSLMDVLTVLLFFLIKIFTVNSMNVDIPQDIILSESKIKKVFEEAITIGISNQRIIYQSKTLVQLVAGRFKESDLMEDRRSIRALHEILKKEFAKRESIFTNDKGEKVNLPPGKLLIEADKNIDFSVLKYILHTATLSGYGDFQFLVRGKE